MRNRNFLWLGTIFLLVPLLTVGCGVAQEQYDAVVADLNQASKELQSVRSELVATQDEVSELTAGLKKAETELEAAEAKNSELTSSLEKAENELQTTQAGSAELTASVQKSQAELEAAQAKVSELTWRLEKVKNELEPTKSEYEAFKSEVESLLVLSLAQHEALQTASRDARSAAATRDSIVFSSAVATVNDILADLNDVKAAELRYLWKEAKRKPIILPEWWQWGLKEPYFFDFQQLNRERISAFQMVLSEYYNK